MPGSAALHYSVPHGIHLLPTGGVTWRQTTVIHRADRHERKDGIVVAAWPRLAFDLAADLRPLDHLSVVHQLINDRRVTVDELVSIDRRLGHPARPGSGRFRRTLESLGDGGAAASDSHPEVVLAAALRQLGVPVVEQAEILRPDGRRIHVDFGVPRARWGVELDIHPEHRSVEGHAADAERRRHAHRAGWQIEVVSGLDMRRPDALATELAGLYRMRCRDLDVHPSVEGREIRPPTLR